MRTVCSALTVVMLVFALGAAVNPPRTGSDGRLRCPGRHWQAGRRAQGPYRGDRDGGCREAEPGGDQDDLKDISDAQSDLSDDRRSEAEAANKAFRQLPVEGIAAELGTSLSASDAKAGIVTALQQLAASYKRTFPPVNCD